MYAAYLFKCLSAHIECFHCSGIQQHIKRKRLCYIMKFAYFLYLAIVKYTLPSIISRYSLFFSQASWSKVGSFLNSIALDSGFSISMNYCVIMPCLK